MAQPPAEEAPDAGWTKSLLVDIQTVDPTIPVLIPGCYMLQLPVVSLAQVQHSLRRARRAIVAVLFL